VVNSCCGQSHNNYVETENESALVALSAQEEVPVKINIINISKIPSH